MLLDLLCLLYDSVVQVYRKRALLIRIAVDQPASIHAIRRRINLDGTPD